MRRERFPLHPLRWGSALLILLMVSCEPDTTCYKDMETYMVVTLRGYTIGADNVRTTYTAWDSIQVQGIGVDTILYSPSKIEKLALELCPDTTLTAYLMNYHGSIDTLWITHTPRLQFVSLACGCYVNHTLTGARSSDARIDSVVIINASVETVAQENIRIYMHE